MRHEKCDVYTTKETLGYKRRKTYVAATKGPAKRGKPEKKKWRNKLNK